MKYKPDPIDTSDVKLPEDVINLTEMLARNAHEVWALQRIQDGWKYGIKRDDSKKSIPAFYHMKNYLRQKNSMTGMLQLSQ
jgi:ryanodine receptor 2